ncbi:peptidoglycan-binding protein [Streptomyces griseus]|uniref:peptidoglycan-binding domain-containing protein n=1 Tax=Streptomyces griseus TaxID=1911 RepID=UPI00068ACE45|nr:peptidoglycan-binding protein [Streptomyces griseus]
MVEVRPDHTASGAGQELALLLRAWWEAAADESGRKPTQESLARRVGVNQTTLSRYFNPAHASNAPKDIVRALHATLAAPPDDLPAALALAETAAGVPAPLEPPSPFPGAPAQPAPPAPAPNAPKPPRSLWRAALVAAVTTGIALASWALLADRRLPETHDRPVAAARGPVATARWPLVRLGEKSSLTWTIQRLLRADGRHVKADGIFGPETRRHVIAFQRTRGLQPDGKVGERTWPMLVRPVASGAKGPEVEAVQDLLDRAGLPADITGVYTTGTLRAVSDFQTRRGLPPTGTVDTPTWRALTASVPRP